MWVTDKGSQITQRASAVGGGAFGEATGATGVGLSPLRFSSLLCGFCLDRTLVLGSSRWSKEMTHDHDFGKLGHKSPEAFVNPQTWLSVTWAEGSSRGRLCPAEGASGWHHLRQRKLGVQREDAGPELGHHPI